MAAEPIFVVQHHIATADHYDFRLEIDGVLASWAVPKGPATEPGVRRLAKQVGDHDMAHAGYEAPGSGPRNRGLVEIWDRGSYRNTSTREGREVSAAEAVRAGHLSFALVGARLHGPYSLIRTGAADSDMWLLIRKR